MNLNRLLDKAKAGQISKAEIARVAYVLQAGETNHDPYTLLHIIGRSGFVEYEKLVARYLQSESDPMLTRLALQILCSFWNKTPTYLDRVKEFVRGVEWDEGNDIRLMAISIAGEYLRHAEDRFVFHLLVESLTSAQEDRIVREGAYVALARAYGKEWAELPRLSRHFDVDRDVDPTVIKWAVENARLS
ncbi:MAG: hypothetical protein ACRERD_32860, partial [Candidatus Binatia bacterium]